MEYITEILCALIVGCFGYLQVKANTENKKREKRDSERREESLLIMQMLNANSELTDCLTMIVMTGDSSICDVQDAKQRMIEANKNYRAFLEKLRLEQLH